MAPGRAELEPHAEPSLGRGADVYDTLERPNWAPWLRFSAEELDAQATVFPEGQILLCDQSSRPLASLSSNRILWDGDVDSLPTWDAVAGETRTYHDTYTPDGNAIVLMSVNVRPDAQGLRLTDALIDEIRGVARGARVQHVISDFRPSEFGAHKRRHPDATFAAYCAAEDANGLPIDQWLRSLARKGMESLRVDRRAMVVHAPLEELERFRREYRPERWYRVEPAAATTRVEEHALDADLRRVDEVWECEDTGTWYVDRSARHAVYVESNLWGRVPLD